MVLVLVMKYWVYIYVVFSFMVNNMYIVYVNYILINYFKMRVDIKNIFLLIEFWKRLKSRIRKINLILLNENIKYYIGK